MTRCAMMKLPPTSRCHIGKLPSCFCSLRMDAPSISPLCAQQMQCGFSPRRAQMLDWVKLRSPDRSKHQPRLASVCQRTSTRRFGLNSVLARAASKGATSTLQETATLDKLIDLMLSARSPEELGKIAGENLLAFDQKFWLRLATRSDTASSEEDKKRLQDLAGITMRMVDAMVRKSDSQLTDSAGVLQKILVAAADENGEWQLPLSDEKLEAMQKVMEANADALDESLLANAFAWMRKAKSDNLEGTVLLLQKALQLYSARALVSPTPPSESADAVLEEVLALKDTQWLTRIQEASEAGAISETSFMTAIRKKMENVVLALPSGSYAQRVQAEYLKEVEDRAGAFFKK